MKLKIILKALTLSILLCSCTENPTIPSIPMQEIKGRDYDGHRFNVYRVRAPNYWIRKDSFPEESLTDTKKSICEFLIPQGNESIRISIHNFPSESIDQRIPPGAQVARWQRQFEIIYPEESSTSPQAFSGYSGLKFKGVGRLKPEAKDHKAKDQDQDPKNQDITVIGWTLQLGKDHYRTLSHLPKPSENNLFREMRADVTIKVVGPKDLMQEHEEEIIAFARSFELIEEIPTTP
ncbi:MAG TPA: hypothetical protein VGP47_10320 [Parachlamydiaceae bacterium]|nr:hypothetical protein [Parachlamydiaceae bacterium]